MDSGAVGRVPCGEEGAEGSKAEGGTVGPTKQGCIIGAGMRETQESARQSARKPEERGGRGGAGRI